MSQYCNRTACKNLVTRPGLEPMAFGLSCQHSNRLSYRATMQDKCIDELERTTSLIDKANSTILIGGDLDLGDINWNTNTVNPGATHAEECSKLLDLSESQGFTKFINEHARITETCSNCLDLMFHRGSVMSCPLRSTVLKRVQ